MKNVMTLSQLVDKLVALINPLTEADSQESFVTAWPYHQSGADVPTEGKLTKAEIVEFKNMLALSGWVILLDEIYIPEKELTLGLYYWPWKNEFVTWASFDHDKAEGKRGFNWGNYFSADSTAQVRNQRSGLSRATADLYNRAEGYGWSQQEGSMSCR